MERAVKVTLSRTGRVSECPKTQQNLRLLERWRLGNSAPTKDVVQIFSRENAHASLDKRNRPLYIWAEGLRNAVGVIAWVPGRFVAMAHVAPIFNDALGDLGTSWSADNIVAPLVQLAEAACVGKDDHIVLFLTHGFIDPDFSSRFASILLMRYQTHNIELRMLPSMFQQVQNESVIGGVYLSFQPACRGMLTIITTLKVVNTHLEPEENFWPCSAYQYGVTFSDTVHPGGLSAFESGILWHVGSNLLALWQIVKLEPMKALSIDLDAIQTGPELFKVRMEFATEMRKLSLQHPRVSVDGKTIHVDDLTVDEQHQISSMISFV